MGFEDYSKRAQESSRELRLTAAKVLDVEIERLVATAKSQHATRSDPNAVFYPERYGPFTEVAANEVYAMPKLWSENSIVSERLFDDPVTHEAQRARFLRVGTLPRDRSKEEIKGPLGVVIFLDNDKEVIDVQAKCNVSGQQADAPAVVLIDIAEALKEVNDRGDIEFEQSGK